MQLRQRAYDPQFPQCMDSRTVHVHVILIGAVQDPADPLFLCQILQRHKQMALAQITAVYGVEAYFLLLQFIHLYDLVDSPQLTGHPPGDLQVTGWVEPAVKCHCVHPFPCFGSRVSRQFKEQA